MKNKQWSIVFGILFLSLNLSAQDVQTELIYQIKDNEKIIHQDEHRIGLNGKGKEYILFVERYENGDTNHYMIKNGEEHGPYDHIFDPEISHYYYQKDFYHFVYHKDDMRYLNWNGKIYGPYEELGPRGGWYHFVSEGEDNLLFTFRRGEDYFANVNGTEYGPYDKIMQYYTTYSRDMKISENGDFIFQYEKDEKHYFNVSGKVYGPAEDFSSWRNMSVSQFYKGYYWIRYKTDDKAYVIINGDRHGPYDEVKKVDVTSPNDFIFKYVDGGKEYFNFNGEDYGPYDEVKGVKTSPGMMMYYTKNGDDYIQTKGQTFGPYKNIKKLSYWNDGTITYISGTDKTIWVHINDEVLGPYDEVNSTLIKRTQEGGIGFKYRKEDEYFMYVNGKSYGPVLKGRDYLKLIGKKAFGFSYKNPEDKKYYVNISGKKYGPFDGLDTYQMRMWGKKDYVFKYSIDGQWYAQMGKDTFGPYEEVYVFNLNGKPWFNAKKEDGDYTILNGEEAGPFKNVWWKDRSEREAGIFYYFQDGKRYKVDNGKVTLDFVSKEEGEEDPRWRKAYGDYDGTQFVYSYKNGNIRYKDTTYAGAAKNAFNFAYDQVRSCYFWLSLEGNNLYSNQLKD